MNVSIKNRIYLSFFLLVLLFVANGIATIITLNNNKKLTAHVTSVTNTSLQSLEELEDIFIASKLYTTNWVFLRSNQDDKAALERLHNIEYPAVKLTLQGLSPKWNNRHMSDSLHKLYTGFEELLEVEKLIMSSLQKFEDYDDAVLKLEAERMVEDELLPRTSSLMNALEGITSYKLDIRDKRNKELEDSFVELKMLISVLAITIIFLGIFLSIYMSRLIIAPINKIRDIVNDLGKGVIRKLNYETGNNEIGEMLRSVHHLSEKLASTADFATEIGNRNFSSYFEPLGVNDTLGKALVTMRDNLKTSDESLNESQHIAKLGSWERNVKTGAVKFSDEMFGIFELDRATFDYNFQTVLQLMHPDDVKSFSELQKKYLSDHQPVNFECRIMRNGALHKTLLVQSKVILDNDGQVYKTFGIAQDITERKHGEEKLAEERELFRLVIENIPDQIYLKDTESRFLLCNMPVAINAGLASQLDMRGKTDFDFMPPETAKLRFTEEQIIIQSGIPLINHEECLLDKVTGKMNWGLNTKVPLRNKAGNMIGLIGINHDITEQKIAEKKLEDVNRELNILFNSIDEVFFSINMTSLKVIQVSATCETVYGYKQSEFMANYTFRLDIIHPDDKYIIEHENEIVQRGEQINNQYRIIRKDKIVRWVENKIIPTMDINGNLIRVDGVTRDITERKNAEVELHKSEERYRQIVETAQEGIWMFDENYKTNFANKRLCEIFGYPAAEMLGKDIFYFMNEEGKKIASASMEKRRQGSSEAFDLEFNTKAGSVIWTYLVTSPVMDDSGKYIGALAMVTDITNRKHDEELLKKSQARLATNNHELEQKNKELEQFAYVASHDLQEPLRTTVSFVKIFKQQYYGKFDSKADKYLNYIEQASDRMSVLINDLLDFSRIGNNKDIEEVDCNELLSEVLEDINTAITDSKAIIIADKLPVISGYPTEIKQLFQNLTINAIKFRKPGTIPKIKISTIKLGNYWQFSFADNGIGIEKVHFSRIFVIFQRLHTRTEYKGSGIGLSHCKKIVELHHGKLWVESVPGEGSVFYFTIPEKQ